MSNSEVTEHVVDVRVVEPVPPRGHHEVMVTKYGKVSFQRQNAPQLVLPDRPTRVEAYVLNNLGGEGVMLGADRNVTNWLGAQLQGGATSPRIKGSNAVYVTVDLSVGAPTDTIVVSTVETYLVSISEYEQERRAKKGKRNAPDV